MQETQVPSLGWEDSLEKEMAVHSSVLAWGIPRREEPGEFQSVRSQGVGHDRARASVSAFCAAGYAALTPHPHTLA